jgi:hypothetical protein
VPGQLAARSPRAGNKVTKLPHGTSLLELRNADDIVKTMTAAGYAVRENDLFTDKPSLVIAARETFLRRQLLTKHPVFEK